MMFRKLPAAAVVFLGLMAAACAPVATVERPAEASAVRQSSVAEPKVDARTAARNFITVVDRMEPVVEAECRRMRPAANCDFLIAVDDRTGQGPNAYQTLDASGRPVLAFTLALIADARNQDELAFVLGHEAAHHVAGHLPRTQQSAMAGAVILGTLATLGGASEQGIQAARDAGANVGARTYSKDYELEADELGTLLAWRAGYDPARGAQFFARLPDPGDRFLASHPPTAERQARIWAVIQGIESGRLR